MSDGRIVQVEPKEVLCCNGCRALVWFPFHKGATEFKAFCMGTGNRLIAQGPGHYPLVETPKWCPVLAVPLPELGGQAS